MKTPQDMTAVIGSGLPPSLTAVLRDIFRAAGLETLNYSFTPLATGDLQTYLQEHAAEMTALFQNRKKVFYVFDHDLWPTVAHREFAHTGHGIYLLAYRKMPTAAQKLRRTHGNYVRLERIQRLLRETNARGKQLEEIRRMIVTELRWFTISDLPLQP